MRIGLDIGSRRVKLIKQFKSGELTYQIIPTPEFYKNYLQKKSQDTWRLNLAALDIRDKVEIIATGYGRNCISLLATKILNEITAHAIGASYSIDKSKFILLDLGGQDTKAILIKQGQVLDFMLNDKCAAGSGRYLENMAIILGLELQQLFEYYQDPILLNTVCAVYGETELIGKIAQGYSLENLAAGVNYSVFLKLLPMLEKWSLKDIVFVGGGASNKALIYYLEQAGYSVTLLAKPEYNGAWGCLQLSKG